MLITIVRFIVLWGVFFLWSHHSFSGLFDLGGNPIDQEKVHKIKAMIEKEKDSLEKVNGQDVVVVIGATGSGKSTLINLLMELPLSVDDDGTIVMQDPKEGMPIGSGFHSVTKVPKSATIGEIGLVYDLPGFADTEGAVNDVLNAAFIRHIIIKARSVKALFVTSQAEIISLRGAPFKHLMKAMGLFSDTRFHKTSSLLVINKMERELITSKDPVSSLFPELGKKDSPAGDPLLKQLIQDDKVFFVPKARVGDSVKFFEALRPDFIRRIRDTMGFSEVPEVNISLTFTPEATEALGIFFFYLMENALLKAKSDIYPQWLQALPRKNKEEKLSAVLSLETQKNGYWAEFQSFLSSLSSLELIRPLALQIYEVALVRFKETFFNDYEMTIRDQKIKEIDEDKNRMEKELIKAEDIKAKNLQKTIENNRMIQVLEMARQRALEQVSQAVQQAEDLRKQASESEEQIIKANKVAVEARREKSRIERQIAGYKRTAEDLENDIRAHEKAFDKLEQDKKQMEEILFQSQRQFQQTSRNLADREKELNELKCSLQRLQDQQNDVGALRSKIYSLEDTVRQREDQSARIAELTRELSQARQRIAHLETLIHGGAQNRGPFLVLGGYPPMGGFPMGGYQPF